MFILIYFRINTHIVLFIYITKFMFYVFILIHDDDDEYDD